MGLTTLGERLRWAREVACLSTRSLSDMAGLSKDMVGLIERGAKSDHLEAATLVRLADTLGVETTWLFDGRGQAPSGDAILAAVRRRQRTGRHALPVARGQSG